MRALAPRNTQSPIVERSSGLGVVGTRAIPAALLGLHVYCDFTLSRNSDEPQNLHYARAGVWPPVFSTALTGARRLARGRHVFVPSAGSRVAVVCAPALQRGLKGSELFTAIDR